MTTFDYVRLLYLICLLWPEFIPNENTLSSPDKEKQLKARVSHNPSRSRSITTSLELGRVLRSSPPANLKPAVKSNIAASRSKAGSLALFSS